MPTRSHAQTDDITITFSPLQLATLCTALHFASMSTACPNSRSELDWKHDLLDLRYQLAAVAFRQNGSVIL